MKRPLPTPAQIPAPAKADVEALPVGERALETSMILLAAAMAVWTGEPDASSPSVICSESPSGSPASDDRMRMILSDGILHARRLMAHDSDGQILAVMGLALAHLRKLGYAVSMGDGDGRDAAN